MNYINVLFVYLHDMSGVVSSDLVGDNKTQLFTQDWRVNNVQHPDNFVKDLSRLGINPLVTEAGLETILRFSISDKFRLFAMGLSPVNITFLTKNADFSREHRSLEISSYIDNQDETERTVIENLVYDTNINTSAVATLYANRMMANNIAFKGRNVHLNFNAMMEAGDETINILTQQAEQACLAQA